MSTIDQAFAKAYRKQQASGESSATPGGGEAESQAALGTTSIWVDPQQSQQWRSDPPHPTARAASRGRFRGGARSEVSPTTEQATGPMEAAEAVTELEGSSPQELPECTADYFASIDVTAGPFAWAHPAASEPAAPPSDVLEGDAAAAEERLLRIDAAAETVLPPVQERNSTDPSTDQISSVPFVKIHPPAGIEAPVRMPAAADAVGSEGPVETPIAPFAAAWEVDRFERPSVVTSLMEDEGLVEEAVAPMVDVCRNGLQTLLVTSAVGHRGRTTLAVGLAFAMARAGLRVVLLDLGNRGGDIAEQLQVDVEIGWQQAVRQGMPLQETAIYSVHDRLTVVPQTAMSSGLEPTRSEIVQALQTLRQAFDLVIVDAVAIDVEAAMTTSLPATQIDSSLVVRDVRQPDEAAFEECIAALRQLGIEHIGVAENFAG